MMDKGEGMTLFILILAIALLYFAVTGKINRVTDAFDILVGSKTACAANTTASASIGTGTPLATNIAVSLPSLPTLTSSQVPA